MQNDNKERYTFTQQMPLSVHMPWLLSFRDRGKERTAQPLPREDGRAFDDKCYEEIRIWGKSKGCESGWLFRSQELQQ